MRNWTSDAAFRVAQFLFYYRLAGSPLRVDSVRDLWRRVRERRA